MKKCKDKPPIEDGVLTGIDEERMEISKPVLKHAKLMGQLLYLYGLDGSEDKILVKGCEVMAISGTEKASKKWWVFLMICMITSMIQKHESNIRLLSCSKGEA